VASNQTRAPESISFADDIPRYPYDPERARALLVEAGLGDGVSVRLHTNENPVRIQIAEILQFEAAQVGIDIDVTIEEFGAFIDRILGPDKDFDPFILGWSGNVDPDYATYGLFKTGGDNNYIAYGNAEIDVLLDLGRTLPPGSAESIETYQQIQRLLMSDVPFAFINNSEEIGVVQGWVDGWSVHPYASATFQDLHLVNKTC
jgi:peptide/nickel transport system substrate-binding protein